MYIYVLREGLGLYLTKELQLYTDFTEHILAWAWCLVGVVDSPPSLPPIVQGSK